MRLLHAVIHYFPKSLDRSLSRSGRLKFSQARINRSNYHRAIRNFITFVLPAYPPLVMNFRCSVSDEPILSKFSAEVTISVQPVASTGRVQDGRDVYGDNCA